jgi:mono/diheme cytochrome c family protein
MKLNMVFKLGQGPVAAALVAALGLAACAPSAPPVTAGDAARAGTSVAQLEHGRSLYLARCSVCHVPVAPRAKPAAEWPGHVAEMQTRAHLSADEARLVTSYLVTIASR